MFGTTNITMLRGSEVTKSYYKYKYEQKVLTVVGMSHCKDLADHWNLLYCFFSAVYHLHGCLVPQVPQHSMEYNF